MCDKDQDIMFWPITYDWQEQFNTCCVASERNLLGVLAYMRPIVHAQLHISHKLNHDVDATS